MVLVDTITRSFAMRAPIMNHHNITLCVPAPDTTRESLIQSVAGAVRELVRQAESGATQSEMFRAGAETGEHCARMAVAVGHDNEPAEVLAILRRLLRKEARRRWAMSGEQDREGEGETALYHRKVSVLLDAGADALGSSLALGNPAIAVGASPAAFSVSKRAFSC
jgi:hypothetical protein